MTGPDALARIAHDYVRARCVQSPTFATLMGIDGYDAALDDVSAEARKAYVAELRRIEKRVQTLSPAALSAEERIDVLTLLSDLHATLAVEERYRPWERNPQEGALAGTFALYSLVIRGGGEPPEGDAVLARLGAVPDLLETARRAIADPREVPPIWAEMALDVIDGARVFYKQGLLPALGEGGALRAEAARLVRRVLRAYASYRRWVQEEVLPKARGSYAAGPKLFATLLQHSQGLPSDAEELLARGEREVKRLEEELARVAASLGSPDWRKLFEEYKAIHPSADDLLAVYRRELASAKRFVRARELATIPPRDALQVVETPEFERVSTPFAAYIPPPPFGRRGAAYFWVTPPGAGDSAEAREARLRGHPTLDIALTALHEGYPGHHLQFTWQSRLASPIRKIAHSAAMFEGWALYCEQMMWEEGFLQDPRQELMALAAQLWRACRVVADVRLHTKGMKRDEAADLLSQVAGLERPQALAEANRYTMSPTNPLSYMAGKWMLQDLRAELERRMGATFNLGAFHDKVLSYGAIPIGLIVSDMLEEADRGRAPAAGKAGLRVGRGRAPASARGKRLSSRKPGRAPRGAK